MKLTEARLHSRPEEGRCELTRHRIKAAAPSRAAVGGNPHTELELARARRLAQALTLARLTSRLPASSFTPRPEQSAVDSSGGVFSFWSS